MYQHWDPLKVCVVGRSYPPEFYSWIKVPHVRALFEKIAIETEEDYQNIIKKLQEFNVDVVRPELSKINIFDNKYVPPPMCPRDCTVMIGQTFYADQFNFVNFYKNVKSTAWPRCESYEEFLTLPLHIQQECNDVHNLQAYMDSEYNKIFEHIKKQGNVIQPRAGGNLSGATITRIGRDLYFGTDNYNQDQTEYKSFINQEFTHNRNHIIDTGGHSDGTYCPVCPGLIISLLDVPTYAETFPGWEVVYLPNQSWDLVSPFLKLKEKNIGRWWIPGFEHDDAVIETVETWLNHWTGFVEETVFDVNILIINPKNVMVFNYNKQVFDALERYGITPHIVPFRHRYFWDGGIHCVTSDLHREGDMQDYFPQRG